MKRMHARGLTFIETIVWVALFIVTMITISTSVVYFYRTNSASINEASALAGAQRGINDMMTTIRETGYSSNGAYPVISMAPNDFKFYAAVPGQTFIEQVEYSLATSSSNAATLYKSVVIPVGDPPSYAVTAATTTVTSYVQNLAIGSTTFSYYDANGTAITDYTQIQNLRFVTVDLVLNVDPSRPHTVELRSSAALRNLIGK